MNKQDYEKLRQNLIKHHIDCKGNACTSHPMFMVQKKRIIWGLDIDHGWDVEEVYDQDNCVSYEDLRSYFKDQDGEFDEEYLPELLDILTIDLEEPDDAEEYGGITSCYELWKKYEDEVGLEQDYDVMESLSREGLEITKGYGKVIWEDVSMFFDREAAETFRDRFGYRHGEMRVYVKSGWENDQFRDIISAMIDGKLVWEESGNE
tara:strand:+ start:1830 stop:2447 length:618 start_codon:yes stop_codon:yes gene_type:complete